MSVDNKHPVREVLSLLPTEGDVGIEIECEANPGPNFPVVELPKNWTATHDGSLRGTSIEYVLGQPVSIDRAQESIMELQERIKQEGTRLKYSFRAGVHVHVNCQDMTMQQVLMYAALYYSLENVLVEWCGEDRIGNHFCLRACDAENVLPFVGQLASGGGYLGDLIDDSIRYASLNFCALPKYGSLEFRAMATEKDFGRIAKWAKVLYDLREKSKKFESIQSLLEQFSMSSPREWLEDMLGDFYEEVKNQKQIDRKVWEGVHSAQDLLFYTVR